MFLEKERPIRTLPALRAERGTFTLHVVLDGGARHDR